MRLVVRLLGREVLAVDVDAGRDEEVEPLVELGPPFGFTGSAGGIIEHADPRQDGEVIRHGR